MKLIDFLEGVNIFDLISSEVNIPIITSNKDILNLVLLFNYGERQVFEAMLNADKTQLSKMISLEYESTWLLTIESHLLVEGLYSETETVTTKTAETVNTGSKNDLNKVAAYNSSDLITVDGSEVSNSDNTLNDEEITVKVVDKNIHKAYDLLSKQAKNSINRMIADNVAKYLTLSIY